MLRDVTDSASVADLFRRIQDQALDSSVPLADTLRLCIAAGARLGAPELTAWARAELNGYSGEAELPEYRVINAPLLMNYVSGYTQVTGQRVTSSSVPDWFRDKMEIVRLRDPLNTLEKLAASEGGEGSLSMTDSVGGGLIAMVQSQVSDGFTGVTAVYWSVAKSTVGSVVDQVRTKLVEMVAAFDATISTPGADTTAAVRNAVSVVAEPGSTIHVTNVPDGTVLQGTGGAVVTANTAGGDLAANASGRDTTEAPATVAGHHASVQADEPERSPRFWESGWWNLGRALGGAAALVIAGLGVWVAVLAL